MIVSIDKWISWTREPVSHFFKNLTHNQSGPPFFHSWVHGNFNAIQCCLKLYPRKSKLYRKLYNRYKWATKSLRAGDISTCAKGLAAFMELLSDCAVYSIC